MMAMPADNLPPERPYSRMETDLKLENLEQRIDAKLDKILSKFDVIDKRFESLERDISWLRSSAVGTFFLVLAAILKLFFHLG